MKKRLLFILLILLLILPYAHSKNEKDSLFTYDKNQPILSERLPFDDFFELVKIYLEEDNTEEVIDLEYLETELKTVYEAPVNWNTATREELRSIQIISELEIEELPFLRRGIRTCFVDLRITIGRKSLRAPAIITAEYPYCRYRRNTP